CRTGDRRHCCCGVRLLDHLVLPENRGLCVSGQRGVNLKPAANPKRARRYRSGYCCTLRDLVARAALAAAFGASVSDPIAGVSGPIAGASDPIAGVSDLIASVSGLNLSNRVHEMFHVETRRDKLRP